MTDSVEPLLDSTAAPEPARPTEKSKQPARSWESWLGHGAGAIAFLALVFSLFGLGVIIGLATLFHLHPGLFTASTFDLLMACWAAILIGFSALTQVSIWHLICATYDQWLPVALVCSFVVAVYRILRACVAPSAPGWWVELKNWRAVRPGSKERESDGVAAWAVLILLWLWPAISAIAGWILMLLAASVVTIIPMLGYSLGQAAGLNFVIKPDHCAISRNRAQVMAKQNSEGAVCVVITGRDADKSILHKGRVVLSTGTYVLLYDTASGVASRVVIGDKVVRSWSASDREQ